MLILIRDERGIISGDRPQCGLDHPDRVCFPVCPGEQNIVIVGQAGGKSRMQIKRAETKFQQPFLQGCFRGVIILRFRVGIVLRDGEGVCRRVCRGIHLGGGIVLRNGKGAGLEKTESGHDTDPVSGAQKGGYVQNQAWVANRSLERKIAMLGAAAMQLA